MPSPTKSLIGLSGAIVTMLLAIIGAYLAIDRHVSVLAATAVSAAQVEHIIDLKTSDRLDEILRHLEGLERKIDRLQYPSRRDNMAFSQKENP